jgi:hypothetical protein
MQGVQSVVIPEVVWVIGQVLPGGLTDSHKTVLIRYGSFLIESFLFLGHLRIEPPAH